MDNSSSKELLGFIETPEFINAWKEVNERSVLWDDFKKLPTPHNISSEKFWEIITSLRYHSGLVLPFIPYVSHLEGSVWFSVPKDMQIRLQHLSRKSHQSSALWQYIAANKNKYFRLFLYLDEVTSVFRRDGVVLDGDRLKTLWLGGDKARGSNEELLLRFRDTLFGSKRYLHRKITRGLIEELFECLVDGLDYEIFLTPRLTKHFQTDRWEPEYTIEQVCTLADKSVSEGLIHPIFSSINISGILWDHRPLPAFNATIDLLLKKIFYTQCGHPLLAYLPFSTVSERWERGQIKPDNGIPFRKVLDSNCRYGYDSTGFHAAILDLFVKELDSLAGKVSLFREREDQYKDKIAFLPDLNHRQRQMLVTALLAPGKYHTIASFQEAFKVSYATARADLLSLAQRGFFDLSVNDKVFLFILAPNCLSLIDDVTKGSDEEET